MFRLDAEQPTGRDIRLVYRAVQVGDDICVGREIEQLAKPAALSIERVTAGGKRLASRPELFVGEAELLDGGDKALAIASFRRSARNLRCGRPVPRTLLDVAHVARRLSEVVGSRLVLLVHHSAPAMSKADFLKRHGNATTGPSASCFFVDFRPGIMARPLEGSGRETGRDTVALPQRAGS